MLNQKLFFNSLKYVIKDSKTYSSVIQKTPVISCKHKNLNFYGGTYKKNTEIPLASKNWQHRKSKGDYFIIHRGVENVKPDTFQADSFAATGLDPFIVQAAERENILVPTLIQLKSIRKILSGRHTLITAETGCGKTLAYLLPLLEQIVKWKSMKNEERMFNTPLAVIMTPSRELAAQITDVAKPFCRLLGLDILELVGGYTKKKLMNPAINNVDILVATPGILSKFLSANIIHPNHLIHVVLDEADTLLDDSFEFKMSGVLRKIKFRRELSDVSKAQLTLVSATMPSDLSMHLSQHVDTNSILKTVSLEAHKTLPNLPQRFLRLGSLQKPLELLKLVRSDVNKGNPLMIFSNKSKTCDFIHMFLNEHGIKCVHLNGDMGIAFRRGVYEQYDKGDVDVISCTDMLARGLDTIRTKHVLNYDFPMTTSDYLHRIGRVGRIGSGHGCFVTNFVCRMSEIALVQRIEMSVRKLKDLPSMEGNVQKVLRNRSMNNIERARRELMSLTG